MAKVKVYYGTVWNEKRDFFYAVVTGQMDDGTMVYTEIAHREDGSVIKENGEYVYLLDKQYTRTLKHGCQLFFPL